MNWPKQILLATGNQHKVAEMRAILLGLLPEGLELLSLDQIGLSSPPADVERFSTFTANARVKAQWCRDRSGLACIADDSGLCVDALTGMPGIHSARWAGANASDAERNTLLLQALERARASTPLQRRGYFACSAAYAHFTKNDSSAAPDRLPLPLSAFGVMRGHVLTASESASDDSFGYDPIFFSDELRTSVGLAPASEKNRFSHRAHALSALVGAFNTSAKQPVISSS